MIRADWKRNRSLILFELMPVLKGPLPWAALASLVILVIPVRIIFTGEFSVNGQQVGLDPRLNYVLAVGYSTIVFLPTLFTLCLCLDRTGTHYLRNNDLLMLARSLGRPVFYLAKMAAVLLPAIAYGAVALALFWEELYRIAGVNLFRIFLLIFPLSLSMACLVSLYFLMRNYFSNFLIFFIWLLLLPVIYVGNLWRYYAGMFRDGVPHVPILGMLPQFGGIHAYSLGMIGDKFMRDETWHALANGAVWTVVAVSAGLYLFSRKRL